MRIFITGSADGLGRLAAETLIGEGHDVVTHARSRERAAVLDGLGSEVVVGDLADLGPSHGVAEQAARGGALDAVIHNAGVYQGSAVLPVNVVAPYVLTALLGRTPRLVYLSSGMHRGGRADLAGLDWSGARATGSYSDSKLLVTALALAVARRWPDVRSNAVDPGWVPTKMGGPGAPDDLREGHRTQEWLATGGDDASGGYWYHQQRADPRPEAADPAFQDALVDALEQHTGLGL